jgi:hypothetical protein
VDVYLGLLVLDGLELETENKENKGKQRRKPQSRESMLIGVWIEEQVSILSTDSGGSAR